MLLARVFQVKLFQVLPVEFLQKVLDRIGPPHEEAITVRLEDVDGSLPTWGLRPNYPDELLGLRPLALVGSVAKNILAAISSDPVSSVTATSGVVREFLQLYRRLLVFIDLPSRYE